MNDLVINHLQENPDAEEYFNVEFKKARCMAALPGDASMMLKSGDSHCYDQFIVTKSVYFEDSLKRIPRIVVPRGFVTDFASVPQFLWSIIPAQGLGTIPSIIHDYCYVYAVGDRKDVDDIFRENLLKEGMSKFQAYLMWKAVRTFGKGKFDRRTRATEAVLTNKEIKQSI